MRRLAPRLELGRVGRGVAAQAEGLPRALGHVEQRAVGQRPLREGVDLARHRGQRRLVGGDRREHRIADGLDQRSRARDRVHERPQPPPAPARAHAVACDVRATTRASTRALSATAGTAPRSGAIPSVVTATATAPRASPARMTADTGGRPSPEKRVVPRRPAPPGAIGEGPPHATTASAATIAARAPFTAEGVLQAGRARHRGARSPRRYAAAYSPLRLATIDSSLDWILCFFE